MKEIRLLNLSCKNFMGFLDFNHAFDGKSTDVLGANGTGKTTLKSLFNWILFGKNAEGDSDSNFSIRPLKKDGTMLRQVDIVGELVFDVDGQKVELKRVQTENWAKKRGSIESEFLGNNTEYYIDSVPKKKSEYDRFINDLVDSEVFKLITDVEYFGSLHWKKQRDIINRLLAIDENSILNLSKDFLPLVNYNKPVDEIVLQVKAEQSRINKDLELLPAKIDERASDIDNKDRDENLTYIDKLKGDILLLNSKLENLNKGKYKAESNEILQEEEKNLAELNKQLIELNNSEIRAKVNFENENFQHLSILKNDKFTISTNISNLQNTIKRLEIENSAYSEDIDRKSKSLEGLYAEHKKIKERAFIQGTCPLGKICTYEDVNADAFAKFNEKKAQDLEQIVIDGKNLKATIESIKNKVLENQTKINDCNKEIDIENKHLVEYDEQIELISNKAYEPQFTDQIKDIQNKIDNTKKYIENLKKNKFDSSEFDDKISNVKQQIEETNDELFNAKKVEDAFVIIEDYQKQIKDLQVAFEKLEQIKMLCEKFYVLRNKLIDKKNSEYFKVVRFKMFEEQINGGINETCVATVNGVPFKDLNHAMKINAGLDIINSLQQIYDVKAPIWIDNAEAITEFGEINSQCIKLYVAETGHKKLEFIEKEIN